MTGFTYACSGNRGTFPAKGSPRLPVDNTKPLVNHHLQLTFQKGERRGRGERSPFPVSRQEQS